MEVSPDQLRTAIEGTHACKAMLSHVQPVREEFDGQVIWEGVSCMCST